jgi:hypothetical protein
MIIAAKFASVCPCCNSRIVPGSKVEWSKGSPAKHTACSGAVASTISARPAGRSYTSSSSRGRWNGCSCGAREMPDGSLSASACASCRFDHE